MSSENEQPPGRTGRHAAPRLTVRGRIKRPVGRAIALTAMPTALLMGTLGPKLAFAADGAPKVVPNSVPASVGPTGAACTKGAPGTGTGATTPAAAKTAGTAGKAAGAAGSAAKTVTHAVSGNTSSGGANLPTQRGGGGTTGSGSGSTGSGSASGGSTGGTTGGGTSGGSTGGTGGGGTGGTTGGTGAGTPTPSASPSASDPLGGILGGLLGGILGGHSATSNNTGAHAATPQPSTTPSATHTAAHAATAHTAAVRDAATSTPPATPTATASAPTPTASSTPTQAAPSPTQTTPAPTSTPSSSPSTGATNTDPNKACDISRLAAPLDTSVTSQLPAGTMPVEKWTLHSSDLKLINSVFHGVVTVPLADGTTQRVLKFTAEAVNIGDLDMSANQRGQEVHVKGSPGSTSTMRGGTVTMYVTELKGTLLAAEGIPLSLLNVNLDLTPDTLPQWLYNLIGAVPIPLTLELGNVTAIQQGQFGGNLTIPGMHLYYTPLGQ